MLHTQIFTIEWLLYDIKDTLLPYIEYPTIRLQSVVQSVLDEICFVQGKPVVGYTCPIGELQAIEELLEYDIPLEICSSTVFAIKKRILDEITPVTRRTITHRLSYIQLSESEFAISIYYYLGKRFLIRPHETVYAN